jgi:uncharacterized protein DUF4160
LPRISAFYGIVIYMYFDEARHEGRPHFHAVYGGDEASVGIDGETLLAGELPRRALRLVAEWASGRQDELEANWERARRGEPLEPIAPLP